MSLCGTPTMIGWSRESSGRPLLREERRRAGWDVRKLYNFSTSSLIILRQQIRCSIVVSILACHAGDPGSIPGGGTFSLPFMEEILKRT